MTPRHRTEAKDRRTLAATRARVPRTERAQSLAEFALLIPVFLILMFGVVDFGMGLRAYITVAQATREGARFAAVGNAAGAFTTGGSGQCNGSTNTTVVGKVCTTMDGLNLVKVTSVTVTYPNGNQPGNSVRVSTTYNYNYITPVQRIVNFVSHGALGPSIPITSTVDMRLE